jgi:predicted MFS family arabinose efflux permease
VAVTSPLYTSLGWRLPFTVAAASAVQAVAIKVINLLPSQRLQLEYACRECQHLSQVHHECIVEVVTFYAAQVRQRQKVVEPS